MSKKTKIICTIGPASESKEVLTKLVEAGMNIARLNFSHGDYEEHAERVKRIREVSKETGKPIGILLDTKGPEIRLGDFENGGCEFAEGDEIDLVKEEVLGNHERFTLRCPEVFNDVQAGDYILMDEATNALDAENESEIICNMNNFLRGRTAVIIAHRLSTIRNANNIIVLGNGSVVEQGTHEELVSRNGIYHTLVKNQLNI